MRILILSPAYPPLANGVADHTREFGTALANSGNEVSVLTSGIANSENIDGKIRVFAEMRGWGFRDIGRALKRVRAEMPDRVVIQYLPFLYSERGGINFAICMLALCIRRTGFKVDLICHEIYYPPLPNPKALVLFGAHVTMLALLGLTVTNILTSTERFARRTARICFWRAKPAQLPVGANLLPCKLEADAEEKFRHKYGLEKKDVIACFGTAHPTRDLELSFSAICDWADLRRRSVAILVLSQTREAALAQLSSRTRARAETRVVALGRVSREEFSLAMKASDAAVAYYADGASTRRGSLLATIAHQVPTISSASEETESSLAELRDLTLLPSMPDLFRLGTVSALDRIFLRGSNPVEMSADPAYVKHFSWAAISARYLNLVNS